MRAFTAKDADFLEEARLKDFPDCWKKEDIIKALASGELFGFIEEVNGETAAAVIFERSYENADLEDIYVAEKFRKCGVAYGLLQNAFKELFSAGVQKVFLEVREGNLPARALYEKAGFTPISVRKKYYGEENAVVYLKEIEL